MHKLTIIVGVQENAQGDIISDKDRALGLRNTRALLASEYGGYTETTTMGGWLNPEERLVTELGRKFEVYAEETDNAKEVARLIARYMQQHSVVLDITPSNMMFINKA